MLWSTTGARCFKDTQRTGPRGPTYLCAYLCVFVCVGASACVCVNRSLEEELELTNLHVIIYPRLLFPCVFVCVKSLSESDLFAK